MTETVAAGWKRIAVAATAAAAPAAPTATTAEGWGKGARGALGEEGWVFRCSLCLSKAGKCKEANAATRVRSFMPGKGTVPHSRESNARKNKRAASLRVLQHGPKQLRYPCWLLFAFRFVFFERCVCVCLCVPVCVVSNPVLSDA